MSKQTKIIIGIVAGISVLCLIGCIAVVLVLRAVGPQVASQVEKSVNTEPEKVSSQAADIADFTLPDGFQAETSMDLFGIKMAMYSNPDNDHFIALIQMPTEGELTKANIEQMRQNLERSASRGVQNLKTIEQRELTIRGEPAQMVLQEGTRESESYRQLMVAFQGKDGLAMLMITGPANTWDQTLYDNMISSIH